jgi:Domain of unknown function (DUF4145)
MLWRQSAFEKLRTIDVDLAEYGINAEEFLRKHNHGPRLCVIELRAWVERIVDCFERSCGLPPLDPSVGEKLKASIDRLATEALISESKARNFHTLREVGNRGVHHKSHDPVTHEDAVKLLALAQSLCGWLTATLSTRRKFFLPSSLVKFAVAACVIFGIFLTLSTQHNVSMPPTPLLPARPAQSFFPRSTAQLTTLIVGAAAADSFFLDVLNPIKGPGARVGAKVWYEHATPGQTSIRLTLANSEFAVPCELVAQHETAAAKCDWTDVAIGNYTIAADLDGKQVLTKQFSVVATIPSTPNNAVPPSAKTSSTIFPAPRDTLAEPKDNRPFGSFVDSYKAAIDAALPKDQGNQAAQNMRRLMNTPGCELMRQDGMDTRGCVQGHIDRNGNLTGPGGF